MPFFRKSPGSNHKSKLEHKLRVAKETPESSFDLTDCGIPQIPSGVFSMCRVFLKEELLLSRNNLTTLKGGGNLQDLSSSLSVLDLSFNKFTHLPEEIGCLSSLLVLNLSNNQLKKLPHSFGNLSRLESLDLSGNLFKQVPECISRLFALKTFNVTENPALSSLPSSLSHLRVLQDLLLDAEKFVYPPSDVCLEGTEAILRFLCCEQQVEYRPPSDSQSSSSRAASISSGKTSTDASPISPMPPVETSPILNHSFQFDTFLQHQLAKDRRRRDLLEMEEAMRQNQQVQLELGVENLARRQRLLDECKQEQERFHAEIQEVQSRKEKEKIELFSALYDLEVHSSLLISNLLELNERNKSSEAISAAMERDKQEAEDLFAIKQFELEDSRKKDVLESMKEMLAAEERQRVYEAKRLEETRKNTLSPLLQDKRIQGWLLDRENDQQSLFNYLLEEEKLQQQAFHALQVQRDSQHLVLTQQIKLIELELAKLTEAEIHRKELRNSTNVNLVAEQRATLAELLASLLEQRDTREELLKQRLIEMEANRVEEIKDYWLIQYQKLMDRKPQEIIDLELAMDPAVKNLLIEAGAERYISQFASAQLTIDQLLNMTTADDFYRVGLTDSRVQGHILATISKFRSHYEEQSSVCHISPPTSPHEPSAPSPVLTPTAPEQGQISTSASISTISRLWHQAECVICMDKESGVVFLPCGHVCTCWSCAKDTELCPLCRIAVQTKLTIGTM